MEFDHKLLVYKVEDKYGAVFYTQATDAVQAMNNCGLVYHILGSITLETHLCYEDGVLYLYDNASEDYVQLNTSEIVHKYDHYEYKGDTYRFSNISFNALTKACIMDAIDLELDAMLVEQLRDYHDNWL